MSQTCPTCNRVVEGNRAVCPHDGTPLGTLMMDPLLGVVLGGRYLLRECVGSRGRFRTYAAELEGLDTPLLAMVHEQAVPSEVFERFRALAQALTDLDHPVCGRIRDFGRTPEGMLYLVEEGEMWHLLSQDLEVKGRLPVATALDLAAQLLEGIDHLHGLGLTHGALTPAAIRLSFADDGRLALQLATGDIACRAVDPDLGSQAVRYTAGRSTDPTAQDIHAASAILTEMLTGEPPDMSGWRSPALRQLDAPAEDLARIEGIVSRGLGHGAQRYTMAGEMLRDLRQVSGHSRFGRYELLHQIGKGGMGEIYLARAEGMAGLDLDRLCVIKTIRTSLAADPKFVVRFLAEARVLASLSHGNIVPVYDVGKVGTTFYIAMQYVAGKDVRQILNRTRDVRQRLPVPLALFIARELANGLAYAHRARVGGARGLVHRDVSPHNLLVSWDGEVRLIDFGLVQQAHRRLSGESGVVMGKVCYMSPEQAQGEELDSRSDIYSAGLVLFELLTGEPFFNQQTVEEVLAQVVIPRIHPPSARAAGIPEAVDRICLRAMEPRRDRRYDDAAQMRDDLSAVLAVIAPRTNPEQVGAFVSALFKGDRSDPVHPPDTGTQTALPQVARENSPTASPLAPQGEVISLLGATPSPILMQSTVLAEQGEPGAGPPALHPVARRGGAAGARAAGARAAPAPGGPKLSPEQLPTTAPEFAMPEPPRAPAPAAGDEQRHGAGQGAPAHVVDQGAAATEAGMAGGAGTTGRTAQVTPPSLAPQRPARGRWLVLGAVAIALLGVGGGALLALRLMRPDPGPGATAGGSTPRGAAAAGGAAPPVAQDGVISAPRTQSPDMRVTTLAIRARPKRPRGSGGQGQRPRPRPRARVATCKLFFKNGGPRGAQVLVDGAPLARLPLQGPLTLPATGKVRLEIRRAGYRSYHQLVDCTPGESFLVSAGFKQ